MEGRTAYLDRMRYMNRFSPRGAVDALSDLLDYWRQPTPYRWQILGLSVAMTFTLMVLFIPETQRAEPRAPDVTYISTFAPGRTDAEIAASNLANQKRQEELEAERLAREEERKERARTLGRATGIDVDALEAQMKRRLAEQEAAQAAARRAQAASEQ
jgi:hypothetical protein